MILKRILISILLIFAITIATWIALAVYYRTIDPLKWPEFMQGFFTAINISGILAGIKVVRELFARPRIRHKHLLKH